MTEVKRISKHIKLTNTAENNGVPIALDLTTYHASLLFPPRGIIVLRGGEINTDNLNVFVAHGILKIEVI